MVYILFKVVALLGSILTLFFVPLKREGKKNNFPDRLQNSSVNTIFSIIVSWQESAQGNTRWQTKAISA